ncbi:MAG: hypothetical protein ACRDPK_00440 [Carbonactinosporaceae bacterium]
MRTSTAYRGPTSTSWAVARRERTSWLRDDASTRRLLAACARALSDGHLPLAPKIGDATGRLVEGLCGHRPRALREAIDGPVRGRSRRTDREVDAAVRRCLIDHVAGDGSTLADSVIRRAAVRTLRRPILLIDAAEGSGVADRLTPGERAALADHVGMAYRGDVALVSDTVLWRLSGDLLGESLGGAVLLVVAEPLCQEAPGVESLRRENEIRAHLDVLVAQGLQRLSRTPRSAHSPTRTGQASAALRGLVAALLSDMAAAAREVS